MDAISMANASRPRRSDQLHTGKGAATTAGVAQRASKPLLAEVPAEHQINECSPAQTAEHVRPKWDRNRLELRIGSAVVRQFKIPAANEEVLLAAFEEHGWPPEIANPLPTATPPACLQQTVEALNRRQKKQLIRFLAVADNLVAWQFCAGEDPRSS